MKKLSCLFVVFFALNCNIVSANPYAGADPGIINAQYMRELRAQELKTRNKQKSSIITTTEKVQHPTIPTQEVSELTSITFIGNNVFSGEQLTRIVKDKIGQPMSNENIAAIRRTLMKFYQSYGYFSAVPIVVAQNDKTGEITIEIKEGTKNSIVIE